MMTLNLQALRSDQRGAAVIEMALIAPVFALFIIGISDMSNAYTQKLALEQGAQRSIEKVMQTTGLTTVADTIKTEAVCQVNGVNADGTCKAAPITASNVTVTYRLECKDSGGGLTTQTSTDAVAFDDLECPPTTTEQRYLEVLVEDKYTPIFPVHFASFTAADGTYHLSARAGMRTQ
jgi:Flp pilus assembly protein TadG